MFKFLKRFTSAISYSFFNVIDLSGGFDGTLRSIDTISNWPAELVQDYDRANMLETSPISARLRQSVQPVCWDTEPASDPGCINVPSPQKELFREHGLERGIHFVVFHPSYGPGAMSVAGKRQPPADVERAVIQHVFNAVFEKLNYWKQTHSHSSQMSDRERGCLQKIALGMTVGEIAGQLGLSENTVTKYLASSVAKLGAKNRSHAVYIAARRNYF